MDGMNRMSKATLGIIIPANNEEAFIETCLTGLKPFFDSGDTVLAVDAGSIDRTLEIARRCGAETVSIPSTARGLAVYRGVETLLSAGTEFDAIVIAHADMLFPIGAREALVSAIHDRPAAPGGAMGHRIVGEGFVYRVIEFGNRLRATWLQMPYGDQVQFFRPMILPEIGGFPCQERLEDVELSRRMRRIGPLLFLDRPVGIPLRHWKKGVVRVTLRNWITVFGYLLKNRWNRKKSASDVAWIHD